MRLQLVCRSACAFGILRLQLSLSGKILIRFADQFLVQWPQLADKYPGKARYIGRVC